MQATPRRDTAPERALRVALHSHGLRFRVDRRPDPLVRRKADIVFGPARVAVFIDGCFWHGCPKHMTWPEANAEWWRNKIAATQRRDRDTDRSLQDRGWTVVRVWEHEEVEAAAQRVLDTVAGRTPNRPR
jgi:DNA mismatch endonuclease (patch repair protein)